MFDKIVPFLNSKIFAVFTVLLLLLMLFVELYQYHQILLNYLLIHLDLLDY